MDVLFQEEGVLPKCFLLLSRNCGWWFYLRFVVFSFVALKLFAVGRITAINCIFNYALIYFQISIENDYLGPRRIESLQKEDADWQKKAHMAVLSIQDLTVKYFEITAKTQKGSYFLSFYPSHKKLNYLMFTMSSLYCELFFHQFFMRKMQLSFLFVFSSVSV